MSLSGLIVALLIYFLIFVAAAWKYLTPKSLSVTVLAATVLFAVSDLLPGILYWPILLIGFPITLLIFSPVIQQRLLWKRLFVWLKKNIPAISRTEQIAADAGGIWWEQELLSGAPDWQKLFGLSSTEFTPDEQAFLDQQVTTLCRMVDRQTIEQQRGIPDNIWRYLKKHRFFALVIPEGYGGWGFSHRMHAEVVGRIAVCSSALAVTVMVPNSLGPAELIVKYGTPEQKKYYLPRLSSAKDIPCFGLTSPTAGSDASSLRDTGVICQGQWKNKTVLGLRLNWDKRYITLAPVASLIGLAVKVSDPEGLLPEDHHLHGQVHLGITCVLVAVNTPGVEIGRRHNPMNVHFHNGPIRGKDVFVPLSNIIGDQAMIGEGWRMLMECLAVGRCISLPALSVTANQIALVAASAYSHSRVQFSRPIAKFEAVGLANAHIALNSLTATVGAELALDALDQGHTSAVMSAMVKQYCTEVYRDSINRAMDIHAGRGVMTGPRNYLDELYRAIPIAITVEGANLLLRHLVIFGQGLLRCHPHIRREIDLVSRKEAVDRELSVTFEAHCMHLYGNFLRASCFAWSGNILSGPVSESGPRKLQRQLNTLSAQLATLADICLIYYGSQLKRKELVSGGFAQAWTELFFASALLRKRATAADDKIYCQVFDLAIRRCLTNSHQALRTVVDNIPSHLLSVWLKLKILPGWSGPRPPTQEEMLTLNAALADPEGLRKYLGRRVFDVIEQDETAHPLQVVEQAMVAYAHLETLHTHLPVHLARQALSGDMCAPLDDPAAREVLGDVGVEQWRQSVESLRKASAVDEFE